MNELSVLENIRREIEELPGHLGFYYKNLVTGTEFAIREDEILLAWLTGRLRACERI